MTPPTESATGAMIPTIAVVLPWTKEQDDLLVKLHGTISLRQIGAILGRSPGAIRGRITRLKLCKQVYWTPSQEAELVALYERAGSGGVLHLSEFAAKIGRNKGNVSRKAKSLGLTTNPRRKVVEQRKQKNKYATVEEARAAVSRATKERFATKGHPRGALGMKHTDETRLKISASSKAWIAGMSDEQKDDWNEKKLRSRRQNGSIAPPVKRGSWMAGWREIGGKRNYYRSRWEANYARYLQWLKDLGEIAEWQHEPETFWFEAIKRGVRSYLPDFRVWENNGTSCLHEVKGWMDQRSRTTLSRMAKYHPDQKIIVIDGHQYRAIRLKAMRLVPGWEDSKRDSHA